MSRAIQIGPSPNLPTADQKAALAGTSGAPGAANAFVTNADSRLSDARTPTNGSVTLAKLAADALARMSPLDFGTTPSDGQGWKRSGSLIVPASYVEEGDAAGGQIGGTFPTSLDVRGLRETGGPTLLTMGAVGDGEFLKRDGSNIVGGTAAGGGGGMSRIATSTQPDAGGYWLLTPAPLTQSTMALVVDQWAAAYFYSGQGGTLASIGVYQGSGSGNLRICIYNLNDARYPSTLLANSDTGSFASSSGFCMAPVSCTLEPDTYYVAAINVDASFNVKRPNNHASDVTAINGAGLQHYGWTVSQTFGAPDANFPGGATSVTQTSTPMFFYLPA